ncbi:MAG: hypothetical protein K5896_03110 [Prevotella sp.]|nr:hypothetical protein [Prevotella sp.]
MHALRTLCLRGISSPPYKGGVGGGSGNAAAFTPPPVEEAPREWILIAIGMAGVETGASDTLSMNELLQGWAMAFGDKLVMRRME